VRSPNSHSGLEIEDIVKGGLPVLAERRFVIVRYEGKVSAMASGTQCQRKFFTPATFARDAGAERNLVHKFDLHECEEMKR